MRCVHCEKLVSEKVIDALVGLYLIQFYTKLCVQVPMKVNQGTVSFNAL